MSSTGARFRPSDVGSPIDPSLSVRQRQSMVHTGRAKPLKCKCASLPRVVLGRTTKLPGRHFEVVKGKRHPRQPDTPKAFITLFRCKVCGQYWQADMWSPLIGDISWPEVCIKIDRTEGWDSFDDRALRREHFPEIDNGVAPIGCATQGCQRLAVARLRYCAPCTCALRAKGIGVLPSHG
jgi:hypothetical protein